MECLKIEALPKNLIFQFDKYFQIYNDIIQIFQQIKIIPVVLHNRGIASMTSKKFEKRNHTESPIISSSLKNQKLPKPNKSIECQQFLYLSDHRADQERQLQHKQTEEIYKKNLSLLSIELTYKKKIQYTPSRLFRVDVGNQWYAFITDNELDAQYTIFTVHGAPGDHRQWAGLQQQTKGLFRWINFIIPGFDNFDERRGNYTGSAEDLSTLIVKILEVRKVSKIIYCGHSLGSIFGGYFIHRYPQIVKGYINITGIVNMWYTGLLLFYRTCILSYGFGRGPNQASMIRLLNKTQFRQNHHSRFINDAREVRFDKVLFPQLTITEICAYIKLVSSLPKGGSQFYTLNHKLRLLRVLIFGKNDPLHEHHKTEEQIYSITRGRFKYSGYPENEKLIKSMKKQLQETMLSKHGAKIEAQKIQQYFCYHFDQTGHNAHKRRPKQIATILKVYKTAIEVIQKYECVIKSNL